jgi:cysteine synthase
VIDLTLYPVQRRKNIDWLRQRGVRLPTMKEMRDPGLIPEPVTRELSAIGLWDVHPLNLFRISWKNEPVERGGRYGAVNVLEIPSRLTGIRARIVGLVGKWFPTGAHKVGATYGCLAPQLVTGRFDPARHKAVWPSTGNFCRGGAFNAALIGCGSVAVLPEGMSRERFEWLNTLAGEVILTPGSESNVKEIYDRCAQLSASRPDAVIFNQFAEFGNYLWHYAVTGPAVEEVLLARLPGMRLAGLVSATGSAGTLACGDYLKQKHPHVRLAAVEALQCPTLLCNGYGSHRIEGIGDKHVPWIHNLRNTDMVIAIDDAAPLRLARLFNEPAGRDYLAALGLDEAALDGLPLLGISGIANMLAAIALAKYYELTERDAVFTVFTDSMDLYRSRLQELNASLGPYGREDAIADTHRHLLGSGTGQTLELSHAERKRIHNLKYFTWVEQQGKTAEELDAQWHDWPDYWTAVQHQAEDVDRLIREFNRDAGLD